MSTEHPYVVLLPKGSANPTDRFLVVHLREYVAVHLGEKEHYVFANEHESYDSAATERTQLNHRPQEVTPCPTPTAQTSGVVFTKPKKHPSQNTSPTSLPMSMTS